AASRSATMSRAWALFIMVCVLRQVVTKTSPFGATVRWRACPRLSAKIVAQHPAGKVMPASPSQAFGVFAAASGGAAVSDFDCAHPIDDPATAARVTITVERIAFTRDLRFMTAPSCRMTRKRVIVTQGWANEYHRWRETRVPLCRRGLLPCLLAIVTMACGESGPAPPNAKPATTLPAAARLGSVQAAAYA